MTEKIRSIILVTVGGALTLSLPGSRLCEGEIDRKFQDGHDYDLQMSANRSNFGVKVSELDIISFISMLLLLMYVVDLVD